MQPNGPMRSYALKPEFARKAEARVVAAVAVDMGTMDFAKHGSPEAGSVQEPSVTSSGGARGDRN